MFAQIHFEKLNTVQFVLEFWQSHNFTVTTGFLKADMVGKKTSALVGDQLSPLYLSIVWGCGLLVCLCDAGCWKSLTVNSVYQEIDSRACFSSWKEKHIYHGGQRGRVEATTRWRGQFFHFSHGWILKHICRRVALYSKHAALEQRRQKTHFVVPLVFIPSFDTGIGRVCTNIRWILFTQPLVAQHHEHLFWFASSFHIISVFIGVFPSWDQFCRLRMKVLQFKALTLLHAFAPPLDR